jgi:hypothetical protein
MDELKPLPVRTKPVERSDDIHGGPKQRIVETHTPFRGPSVVGVTQAEIEERLVKINLQETDLLLYERGALESEQATARMVDMLGRLLNDLMREKKIPQVPLFVCPRGAKLIPLKVEKGAPVFVQFSCKDHVPSVAEVEETLAEVRKVLPGSEVKFLSPAVEDFVVPNNPEAPVPEEPAMVTPPASAAPEVPQPGVKLS